MSTGPGNDMAAESQEDKIGPANRSVSLLVAGAFFMENLDTTAITPAIPEMAKTFGVAPVDMNIGVSIYLITLAVFIPASGWIAERLGPRRVFASALLLFVVASMLCGLADSLWEFVATRILQGIGGSLMVPVGRLVVLRVTPKEQLMQAIAMLVWPALTAPVLGPPLGGFIAAHLGWRWIFFINLPLGLIAFVLALKLIPAQGGGRRRPFDWQGFMLLGLSILTIMAASELLSRPSVGLMGALGMVGGGGVLMVLAIRHFLCASSPMIDLSPLAIQSFRVCMVSGSLFRMSINAVPFLIPIMMQVGLGMDAFHAGLILISVFIGNLAMKIVTSPLMRRFGFRRILIVNGLINAVLLALCGFFDQSTPVVVICAILFLGGMARSMQFTAFSTLTYCDIEQSAMSDANTLGNTVVKLSVGMGIAVAALAWRLGEAVLPAGSDPVAPFQMAFWLIAGLGLLGVIGVCRLPSSIGDLVAQRGNRTSPRP